MGASGPPTTSVSEGPSRMQRASFLGSLQGPEEGAAEPEPWVLACGCPNEGRTSLLYPGHRQDDKFECHFDKEWHLCECPQRVTLIPNVCSFIGIRVE